MNKITRTTRLQRLAEITLKLFSDNRTLVEWGGKSLVCSPQAITLLPLFSTPVTLEEVLKQVPVKSHADWIGYNSTIQQLFAAGVLFDADTKVEKVESNSGYGNPAIHIAMLNDVLRTSRYQQAIADVVTPDDVVVEVGAGSGILSATAARQGAKHVYAIEANRTIARIAQETFTKNDFAEQITLIQGWSTQVSVPERADVFISEMIGNDPFGEQVWEITTDAIKRFTKPDARLIPSHLRVFAAVLNIPDKQWSNYQVLPQTIANWQERYQIDVSSLAQLKPSPERPLFLLRPQKARDWPLICDEVLLCEIDLSKHQHMQIDQTQQVTAQENGEIRGVLIYFQLKLSPSTTLSTHPRIVEDNNHWYCPVWAPAQSLHISKGQAFNIQYQMNVTSPGTRVNVWL